MKNINQFMEDKFRVKDEDYMQAALDVASQAKSKGDLPIAAVLVWAGGRKFIEHDSRYSDYNPLSYVIINLINKAAETLGPNKLKDAVLYTTVEPNVMCALALRDAGIKEVVFGAYDDKDGFISSGQLVDPNLLEITAIGGVKGRECCAALSKSMSEHVRHE